MAKVKVYSRFPQPLKFTFQKYVGSGANTECTPVDENEVIVLNGTNEVVNHTLLLKEGALTIFGYSEHNLAERKYTMDDLNRLKEDATFKRLLKNGDVSMDTLEDLSRDFTGVGKLTAKELQERMKAQKGGDTDNLVIQPHG